MWHHWGPQRSPSTPVVGKFKPAQLKAARLITSWASCHVKYDPCKMTIWPFIIHKSWDPVADQWVGPVKRQIQPLSGPGEQSWRETFPVAKMTPVFVFLHRAGRLWWEGATVNARTSASHLMEPVPFFLTFKSTFWSCFWSFLFPRHSY